jgi:hypothetical protein
VSCVVMLLLWDLADEVLYSVPTKVHIYPGLPHGFRRWTQLAATEVFDNTSIECIQWAFRQDVEHTSKAEKWHVYGY